jgi:hypothetical protein
MAKKPETLFKERLLPRLRSIPESWWFKTQMLAVLGIPDVVGCVAGRFCALELKKDEKAPIAKIQIYVLNKIKEAGGYAEICYPENHKKVLKELEKISQLSA